MLKHRCLVLILTLLAIFAHAAKKDIPTFDRDDTELRDVYVQRAGPDREALTDFSQGKLGVVLPTYARVPLFLAYRALQLGRTELARQAAATESYQLEPISTQGLAEWERVRRELSDAPISRQLSGHHSMGGEAFGSYTNCGDAAFDLAAQTLQSLQKNPRLKKVDIQEWLNAQDAVFSFCSDDQGYPTPSTAIPQELPASALLYLRQLRRYQVAAAYFYDGQHQAALGRFDAVAAEKANPLRAWAAHASMRAILRDASLDLSFVRRVQEIRAASATDADKRAAYFLAKNNDLQRRSKAFAQISARAKLIAADKSLSLVWQATQKLLVQAKTMLMPEQDYLERSAELGGFNRDFLRSGQLRQWEKGGDALFDYGGNTELFVSLRGGQEYFDWIRTIQGCTDNVVSPNYTGLCVQEHAHALERWLATKRTTWLVATLVTAQQLSPALEAPLGAALQTPADAMAYLTLRYHAARLLRTAGRKDEALGLARGVLSLSQLDISTINLFKQEALASATSAEQALPYLLRKRAGYQMRNGNKPIPLNVGADGDELLNRSLSAEDQLRLALSDAAPGDIRKQLVVAAWWRADMVGDKKTAEVAAEFVASLLPELAEFTAQYIKASDSDARHYVLARAAMNYRISPHVGHYSSTDFATSFKSQRRAIAADWWCSFGGDDFVNQARMQRIPSQRPKLAANDAAVALELKALSQVGSAADWLAHVALNRARQGGRDLGSLRPMLDAVVQSEALDCDTPAGDVLRLQAQQALRDLPLAAIPGNSPQSRAVFSETALRAEYERILPELQRRVAGKREVHAYHILLQLEKDANDVMAQIKAGADFEVIARQRSADPGSAARGGDLGWSADDEDGFVRPFAEALHAMAAPGLYATPVKTPYGWHIVKVTGIRPRQVPSFEFMRAFIEDHLRKAQSP